MAKAMLIMDMPSACVECDFFARGSHDKPICILCTENCADYLYTKQVYKTIPPSLVNEKQTWCPLREVPEKHEKGHCLKIAIENDCYDATVQDDAWCEGYDKGYNACIDEILGGGE